MTRNRFPEIIPHDVAVSDIDLEKEEFIVGGTQLTETRAAAYSRRVPRGRPSLSAHGAHSPKVNLRISETMKRDLERIATAKGIRQSDVIRAALIEWLKHETV
jgi:hypothetical protein